MMERKWIPRAYRLLPLSKCEAELHGAAVVGVRQHRPVEDAQPEDPIDEGQANPPLLLELGLGRDPGLLPTARCFAPPLRQAESDATRESDQVGMAGRSGEDVVEADPDLTVGALPEGPTPLAGHPHGGMTLLREGRVIEGDPALGGGEAPGHDLDEPGLQQVRWPRRVREKVLDSIDCGLREPIGDRLHGLTRSGKQESKEVRPGVGLGVSGTDPRLPKGREGSKELGQPRGPEVGGRSPRHPRDLRLPR